MIDDFLKHHNIPQNETIPTFASEEEVNRKEAKV